MLKSQKHPQKMSLRVFWDKRLKIHPKSTLGFFILSLGKKISSTAFGRDLPPNLSKPVFGLIPYHQMLCCVLDDQSQFVCQILVGLSNRVSLRSLSRRSKLRVYAFILASCAISDNNLVYFYQNGDQSEPQKRLLRRS